MKSRGSAKRRTVVTIDGPGGSGKSTVAGRLAARLGYVYIDTGAMYRAMALKAHGLGIASDDDAGLRALCARTRIELSSSAGGARVWVDGEDWSDRIRGEEAGALASRYSANRAVREALTRLQASMARDGGVVLEGRDTGSVVFPTAEVKFFLVASSEERARRRWKELQARGQERSLNDVMKELNERDTRDANRSLAPLVRPEGAVEIDTTGRTIEDVVDAMVRTVVARSARGAQAS